MRRSAWWSIVLIALGGILCGGCGGSQEEPVTQPESEPPPPQPTARPRIWDNESSYQVGWPITIRAGVLNTGDAVVNAPRGEFFGVKLQAWRIEQVEVAPEPPAQGSTQEGSTKQGPGQQAAAPAQDASAQQGDGGPQQASAPAEPPAPRIEERRDPIDCDSIASETPRGGVFPLATASSTHRRVHVDRLCTFDRPGRYAVEVVVDIPTTEGADISGPQSGVSFEFELTLPDPPLVARADVSQELFEIGQPIEATVRVTNYGSEPIQMAAAAQLQVQLSAESNGEAVPCTEPDRGRGRGSALAPGDHRETTVNIGERCQLTLPGIYTVTPRVDVPASGARSYSGNLEAPPLAIEIAQPEATEDDVGDEGDEGDEEGSDGDDDVSE